MKKGVTPVIAMIILILIVIALGGVVATWVTKSWSTLGARGEQQINTLSQQMQKTVTIDEVDCPNGKIYIRHTGSVDIGANEIHVYINGVYNGTVTNTLPVGGVTNYTAGALNSGDEIKVTAPGSSSTYVCP